MAQTPIFDELDRAYRTGPAPTRQTRPTTLTDRLRTAATVAALAAAVLGLLVVSTRNPGMALVTAFLLTVAGWAFERITSSSRGRQ